MNASATYAQLSGTYTIGSAGDYATFSAAVKALETEGVSEPVTFKVQPGTYEEQLTINSIPGSSCEVPVVFEGPTAASSQVVLRALDASAFTVKVDKVAGVSFRKMNIIGTGPAISVAPGTDCFSLEDNLLNRVASGPVVKASSAQGLRSNHHKYQNNIFSGGGIVKENTAPWNPNAPVFDEGLVIEGNKVDGIDIRGQRDFSIRGNQLYNSEISVINSWYGEEISKNRVEIDIEEYADTAINIMSGAADRIAENFITFNDGGVAMQIVTGQSNSDEILVANNIIIADGYYAGGKFFDPIEALIGLGVRSDYDNTVKIYHNSIITSGNSDYGLPSYVLSVSGEDNSFDIKNNVLADRASIRGALVVNDLGVIAEMDYNGLSNVSSPPGFGEHSISGGFGFDTSLLIPDSALRGAGFYVSEVPQDFYGQDRGNPPTIGAVEKAPEAPALSGTYTIGGIDGDYASFSEAILDINRLGIADSVLFRVRPGIYTEQPVISGFRDGSITFEGESQDSTEVVLNASRGKSLIIRETGGVSFRYMTIRGASLTNAYAIAFEHNVIEQGISASVEGARGGIAGLTFRSNFFKGEGLYLEGNDRSGSALITDNVFEVEGRAIYAGSLRSDRTQKYEITRNDITAYPRQGENTSSAAGIWAGGDGGISLISDNTLTIYGKDAQGMYFLSSFESHPDLVTKNKIILPDGGVGLDFGGAGGSTVTNNMISVRGSKRSIGIATAYEGGFWIFNNNVLIFGEDDPTSSAFYAADDDFLRTTLKNNILTNLAGGYVLSADPGYYNDASAWLTASDYNDLYTNGEVLALWGRDSITAASLEEWQSITGFDVNSLSVDPQFASLENLTPQNDKLAGAGVSLPEVERDFFGELRPDPPTVGAVELNEGGNQTPTAEAGEDRTVTLPQDEVVLRGIAFDPDGVFRAFRWEKVSGPEVTLERANTANAVVKDLQPGEYVFRFLATDNDGATASDELSLTVAGGAVANQPPTANAGLDKTLMLPNNSTVLRGTGNDPDGVFRAFRWEKVSGPSATLNQQNTANLRLSDLVAGEYVFRFSATDNDGATASDEVVLTVVGDEPSNQPPVVEAGPDRSLQLPNNSIILRGTGNDPDGVFRGFRWEKVSGPSATLNQQNTANLNLSNLMAGEYVFQFSATDNDGATASDETTLRVVGASEVTPLASNTRITAYPNTFRDDVNIKIEASQPESYLVQVHDALGRIYYQDQITAEPLAVKVRNIDLSGQGMQAGVYFISLNGAQHREVIRVVRKP